MYLHMVPSFFLLLHRGFFLKKISQLRGKKEAMMLLLLLFLGYQARFAPSVLARYKADLGNKYAWDTDLIDPFLCPCLVLSLSCKGLSRLRVHLIPKAATFCEPRKKVGTMGTGSLF